MTTKQVLIEARRLIEKPESRCIDSNAEDKYGRTVSAKSAAAVKFCVYGAISRFTSDPYTVTRFIREILEREFKESLITAFNETATHEEVLSLFDRAIAATPQELPA